MLVQIVARRTLRAFWERHADAEQPLRAWYHDVRKADWRSPADVKRVYQTRALLERTGSSSTSAETSTAWWSRSITRIGCATSDSSALIRRTIESMSRPS